MQKIKLYNTLSRAIEPIEPIVANTIGMYCCGPTVYSYAHIGNMRTYIFEDVLRRTLELMGYTVNHVLNITDIGHLTEGDYGTDKMADSAQSVNKTISEIAEHYSQAFFRHCDQLNILQATTVCKASEHIEQIIAWIKRIEKAGYSYAAGNNIYFDTGKLDGYGKLSRMVHEHNRVSDRVGVDSNKKHNNDFVLWFTNSKYKDHLMNWDSPWGVGYPGWHIECSAMSVQYLGEHFDIHCGGVDHIALHHTNEIAQIESVTERQWVNYWIHGEFLLMDEVKMSKSSGSFITLDTLIEQSLSPLDFRYFCLMAHYRKQLKFSINALQSARSARLKLLNRIAERMDAAHITDVQEVRDSVLRAPSGSLQEIISEGMESIANDLNTAQLLAHIWSALKNTSLPDVDALGLFVYFNDILAISHHRDNLREPLSNTAVQNDATRTAHSAHIELLIKNRQQARADKDWKRADDIRQQLLAMNVMVIDKAEATTWKFIE